MTFISHHNLRSKLTLFAESHSILKQLVIPLSGQIYTFPFQVRISANLKNFKLLEKKKEKEKMETNI